MLTHVGITTRISRSLLKQQQVIHASEQVSCKERVLIHADACSKLLHDDACITSF